MTFLIEIRIKYIGYGECYIRISGYEIQFRHSDRYELFCIGLVAAAEVGFFRGGKTEGKQGGGRGVEEEEGKGGGGVSR